jgi:hypothetical protein
MRMLLLVGVVTLILSGCPLRQSHEAAEAPQAPVVADTTDGTEATEAAPADAHHPALRRSRPGDRAILEPIVKYLEDHPGAETAAGLETADWVSYEDVTENELTVDDVGTDAMIYKIVEEDAWLSVLFGPPFSEFYLEFRLSVDSEGALEVISCELLPEPEV